MKIDIDKLLKGDRLTLARAITLIESVKEDDHEKSLDLLEKISAFTGKSLRVGISGVPGVGKSTFIDIYGSLLVNKGHRVAVLAVDPSSPVTGGSILGDKTRMEKLSISPNAFIRPSPSKGTLGGVANKTRETILLCEAAGFDYILIETVGVGQSEFEVKSMVDFFMILMLPNAGDEIQGIKKGILELSDAIIVNKADGENEKQSDLAVSFYENALHMVKSNTHKAPIVLNCSAQTGKNIEKIYEIMANSLKEMQDDGFLTKNRKNQNVIWYNKLIVDYIDQHINKNTRFNSSKLLMEKSVFNGKVTPSNAAKKLTDELFQN